jgi:predicted ester cyclase/pimeloyl-ACP methyl ester carboxylesterase
MQLTHRGVADAAHPSEGMSMATYILIHGAGDVGWYWHLVEAELRRRGNDVVAPDLPCDDDSAGLSEYADTVIRAIDGRTDLVVVAQSSGGFTAPLVCDRVAVDLLVLVAPMIPLPHEAPADYWTNTRYEDEAREHVDDPIELFYQDVPPELASEALRRGRRQSEARMDEPVPLDAWPNAPTRVLLCRDDRLFPAAFVRRVAQERLGITPDEMDGGHTPALSRPKELADRLEAYVAQQATSRPPPRRRASPCANMQPGVASRKDDRGGSMDDVARNIDVVKRLEQAYNTRDTDTIRASVAANFVAHTVGSEMLPPGVEGAIAANEGSVASFPDKRTEILEIFGDGDRVVSHVRMTGTNDGGIPWANVPANGNHVDFDWIQISRHDDEGRIAETWAQMDVAKMFMQLGAMETPEGM